MNTESGYIVAATNEEHLTFYKGFATPSSWPLDRE